MSAKYFAILTNLGAAKMANATALGTKLNLTHMAVGDGGGTLQTPNPAQTALRGERRRAALNMLSVDPNNTSAIIAEQVIPESEGGWWVREIGLYDSDGVLIAVANCPETYKPLLQEGSGRTQTIRMVLTVSSTDAVTIKIDPAVVLVTRQYVDDHVIEVRNYIDSQLEAHARSRNHPDATLSAKGFVQLSSDDNSAAENKAATPASVKKVRDLAVTKAPLNSPSFTGTPTTPTPTLSARGLEMANAEFVAAKIAALVGSAPGVLDTLQKIAAALNNNPNFANEIINQLAGKQPLDSTLTALSGKDIAGIVQYLGLRETISLASNAWSKNTVGSVRNGGTFGSCINPGIYSIAIDDTSSVADIPRVNNKPIYGYGFMIVTKSGTAIEQLYISHPGHIATRQTWHGPERYNPWVVQYSSINKPSPEELGLGDSASKNIGSVSGTVAAGDDVRFSYPVGINQTWHSVTSERRIGVVYTNAYQKPIVVFAEVRPPNGGTAVIEIDGVIASSTASLGDRWIPGGVSAIVPPGGRYVIKASAGGAPSLSVWSELF